jgi:hypothetical protein
VPDVKAVWAHEIGGARMFTVVAITQRYAGHARRAGHILNQCGAGAYMSRYSVVVADDIDPSNLQEVMWAVATRTDPAVDIDIIHKLQVRAADSRRAFEPGGVSPDPCGRSLAIERPRLGRDKRRSSDLAPSACQIRPARNQRQTVNRGAGLRDRVRRASKAASSLTM